MACLLVSVPANEICKIATTANEICKIATTEAWWALNWLCAAEMNVVEWWVTAALGHPFLGRMVCFEHYAPLINPLYSPPINQSSVANLRTSHQNQLLVEALSVRMVSMSREGRVSFRGTVDDGFGSFGDAGEHLASLLVVPAPCHPCASPATKYRTKRQRFWFFVDGDVYSQAFLTASALVGKPNGPIGLHCQIRGSLFRAEGFITNTIPGHMASTMGLCLTGRTWLRFSGVSCENLQFSEICASPKRWAVAKGSSISWAAKVKGDKNSECKLPNGWSRSYSEIKLLFFLQDNEWSRSYREINQHPRLPWNFITHGFLDPSAFPDLFYLVAKKRTCKNQWKWAKKACWLVLLKLALWSAPW